MNRQNHQTFKEFRKRKKEVFALVNNFLNSMDRLAR
jgi:hypothetical protein